MGLGLKALGLGFKMQRVWGLGFRAQGLGLTVLLRGVDQASDLNLSCFPK